MDYGLRLNTMFVDRTSMSNVEWPLGEFKIERRKYVCA